MSKVFLLILGVFVLLVIGLLLLAIRTQPNQAPPLSQVVVNEEKAPTPKPEPLKNLQSDSNLQSEVNVLLPLFDKMSSVPVYLKDEPILKGGTNTERGVAYTNCDNNEIPSIIVKKLFYQKANRKQLVNALKHELTHAWLCRQHLMSVGHGPAFRKKFTQVGGVGN